MLIDIKNEVCTGDLRYTVTITFDDDEEFKLAMTEALWDLVNCFDRNTAIKTLAKIILILANQDIIDKYVGNIEKESQLQDLVEIIRQATKGANNES